MQIEYLSERDDAEAWDAFVEPRATSITDLFAWRRVVRDAYGMASHFLVARDGGRIMGTLGLYELRHPLFGHYLASAVFGTDGGLAYETDAARDALIGEARQLARRLNVAYLLIRTRALELEGFHHDARYRTAVIDLAGTTDEAWKRLPATTRNQVRRGRKEQFTIETGGAQREAFYDVFHQHMRDLGSPGHGVRFYDAVERHLADRREYFVIRDGAQLVGGALTFRVNGITMNYHTVTLREFNRRCPNYLLYWTMIERSYADGCRTFDMGRSEVGSTQLRFKENWMPREIELRYNYFLHKARTPPALNPRNPKFRLAIAAWSRLPLGVTRALGPRLIAGLA